MLRPTKESAKPIVRTYVGDSIKRPTSNEVGMSAHPRTGPLVGNSIKGPTSDEVGMPTNRKSHTCL